MFTFAVPGPITSPYGPREGGFHHGFDNGWLEDDPVESRKVFAPASGQIAVGWNDLVGNFVLIPTSVGTLRLAHFKNLAVKSGDRIVQGVTYLGEMGETGAQARGVHLHTDLWVRGIRVDPTPYFTIPFGKTAPIEVRKKNMPMNIVKKSTLDSSGGVVFGKSEYATLGESVNPVILYKRERDNDIAPAFSATYGPHTPVSDKAWADLIARYTPGVNSTPIASTVALSAADRALLTAIGVKVDALPAEIDRYADGKKQSQ